MVLRLQNSIPRTLWPVYRPPFSETLHHRLLSSQSVATSVLARRGCLLPILETQCEKISQTACDRERHAPTTQLFKPTQLRVKPATSITISTTTTNANATTANAAPKTNTATTAVNATTDTTRNVNTRTTTTTDATTNLSCAHNTKSKGGEMEDTEGEKARGERTRGNRGERTEVIRRVSTTAQNGDDERSYCPGDKPRTTDGHGDSNPIPTTPRARGLLCLNQRGHVTASKHRGCTTAPVVPCARTPAIIHSPRDLSALRSDAPNPWGSLQRRHHRFQPHVTCKSRCPRPPVTETRVLESVRHPYGIGLAKPVFRVPILTHIVMPNHTRYLRTRTRHLHTNLFNKSGTLSSQSCAPSTFISDTHSIQNASLKTFSDILAYALTLPSHLFSLF
jgi:hypothetical protein